MTRLTKHDVEQLLTDYDADPVRALTAALGTVLGQTGLGFDALVELAGLTPTRSAALAARRPDALDELARELNEQRTLPGG